MGAYYGEGGTLSRDYADYDEPLVDNYPKGRVSALEHLNFCLLCAIDTETTGLDPLKHEIVEIAIQPLDANIEPSKTIMPFSMLIRPQKPMEEGARNVNKIPEEELQTYGVDPWTAAQALEDWFTSLKLGRTRQIVPLGHNYAFDRSFMISWLGFKTYEHIFAYHYRDTMNAAGYINDRAAFHNVKPPYQRIGLASLAARHEVSYDGAHRALRDAQITAEVYRRQMRMWLPG